MIDKKIYLECSCGTNDHMIVMHLYRFSDDVGDIYFTINTQMIPNLGFWGRIKAAFRYIFKPYDMCNFGGWTECLVKDENISELEELIQNYKDEKIVKRIYRKKEDIDF